MRIDLEQVLTELGPSLSSAVTKRLMAAGLDADAARQRVNRSIGRGKIRALTGIRFPNRERFLFLEEAFGDESFYRSLRLALVETGSAYGRALCGLEARKGAVFTHYFPIASGLPIEKAKKHVPHAVVEDRLLQAGLIHKQTAEWPEVVELRDSDGLTQRRRSAILVEDIELAAIREWLVKTAWSSQVLKVRSLDGPLPKIGQFAWDIAGPTYLAAIKRGADQPGFLAGDIMIDRSVSEDDLRPFFAKCDALAAQRRAARLQPMLIADFIESGALRRLRERGVLIAMPATVFGNELAKDLRDLVGTIENAAAAVAKDPEAVFRLLERLSKIDGAANNLRGVVIEFMVAHLFKEKGYSITIRKPIRAAGKTTDIDVLAVNGAEVVCCECKGKGPTALVDAKDIEDWVNNGQTAVKAWLKTNAPRDSRRFEFYSSTDYTPDAKALIKQLEVTHVRQPIRFFNGDDIVAQLREAGESALVTIFREQFPQSGGGRPAAPDSRAGATPHASPALQADREVSANAN